MRVKAFLVHKKKKKFVNVKPVRFLHSTRSEMKKKKNKNKIKAYVEQVTTKKKNKDLFLILTRKSPMASPAPPLSWSSASGRDQGRDAGSTNIADH